MGIIIMNGKEYAGSGSEWHEYSTEEKVVGKWIDGKPLYEKTWDFGSDVAFASQSWTNTTIKVSDYNIKNIIGVTGINNGGTVFGYVSANRDQTYVQIYQTRNVGISLRYVTLQYTKTTD